MKLKRYSLLPTICLLAGQLVSARDHPFQDASLPDDERLKPGRWKSRWAALPVK
jgi:hypothetical protein